ncbi:hypothetical protein HHSLTHF2_22580 [Vreelandella venusta]|uniref:Lipoprotein n=1 Tax=Halomonas hydrothermalis TaxID=115561 RepID=A0A6F8U481_9GAMM|nr:hypothetical protein [Halomonas hydrothermalis]BCB08368.1 hypothetical protein HHSLTHF2_22580 [Halomonas hydrothermalis]
MVNRFWMPLLVSLVLLLSACGDAQEDTTTENQEGAASSDVDAQQAPAAEEGGEEADEAASADSEEAAQAPQATEQLEEAEALKDDSDDGSEVVTPSNNQEVQADENTLAADPEDALDEASAMPGETTRSDVDDVIAETERRFEEAQRRLDEQFQEVEQQTPTLEPMDGDAPAPSWETESSLPAASDLDDNLEATDVDALLEDTERRFEEAQKRLEEQFEALEREQPISESMDSDSTDSDSMDNGSMNNGSMNSVSEEPEAERDQE